MTWRAGWLVVAVAVAACAPATGGSRNETNWYRVVVDREPSEPERVARFCDRVLAMKGAELAGELEKAKDAFDSDKSELNRLQLALLLSLPGAAFRDDNAAIALLAPMVRDKGREGSSLRPLALLLHSQLVEWRRTDEALQQQTARLKDEQRRAEALQQKLEALLDMEMKMIEREQNLPKKK